MTNKNTLEYIGVWGKINNPDFNYPEFGVIEQEAGINRVENLIMADQPQLNNVEHGKKQIDYRKRNGNLNIFWGAVRIYFLN